MKSTYEISFNKEEVIKLLQKYYANDGENIKIEYEKKYNQHDGDTYELVTSISQNIEILGMKKSITKVMDQEELEKVLLEIFSNTGLSIKYLFTENDYNYNGYLQNEIKTPEFKEIKLFIAKEKVKHYK